MFLQKLAKALEKNKLPYAIVGGYAVALHGALRGTVDIDLVIRLQKKDLEKVEKLLNGLGLQSRIPVRAEDIFNFRDEYIENKNLIAWSFVNPLNPIEVVDILITTDLSDIKVERKKIHGLTLSLADKKSLIAMKKQSGRKQDVEDVKALEKLL